MQEILKLTSSAKGGAKGAKKGAKGEAGVFEGELELANNELQKGAKSAKGGNILGLLAANIAQKSSAKNLLKTSKFNSKSSEQTPQFVKAKTEAKNSAKFGAKLPLIETEPIKQPVARLIEPKATNLQKLARNLFSDDAVAEKIINKFQTTKTVKLADLDLSKALKISEKADIKELEIQVEKLEKIINKTLTKLDEKIKASSKEIVKKPDLLGNLLKFNFDEKSKIKELINDAKELNEVLPKRLQISKSELIESIKIELAKDKDYGQELLEDLTFTKMLDLAQSLKSGEKMPDISNLFKLRLTSEKSNEIAALAKGAKDVKELLNSLKTELSVNKITFERVQNEEYNPQVFEQKFPKLYNDGFFATTLSAAIKSQTKETTSPVKRLLQEPAKAKKAIGAEKIDFSALKSGKLNELLNASSEKTEQMQSQFKQILNSEQEQVTKDIIKATETAENTDSSEAKAASSGNEKELQIAPKTELKAAFVSGERLNKEQTRAVIENFAQDFKEELAKFKAPLHKVAIALKPAELGEINVTMLARGQNLQVNLQTANASTMNLFVQNQSEIRQALVNMGFTGLSMNFSSGGEGGKNQQQEQRRKGRSEDAERKEGASAEASGVNFTLERYL